MKYIELMEVTQHYEKEVKTDILTTLASLEKDLAEHRQDIQSSQLPRLVKQALLEISDDLKKVIEDKSNFNKTFITCLLALHGRYQDPITHQMLDLAREIRMIGDKLRIMKGLEMVIQGCLQPVKINQ